MEIILASASQRRIDLLARFGFDFRTYTALVEETLFSPQDSPSRLAMENASRKAGAALKVFPDAVIVGADTIVVKDRQILGKPKTAAKASEMLTLLSGAKHRVITGVTASSAEKTRNFWVETIVKFRPLAAYEIQEYIQSGEPLDKAGAYGIQGIGGAFVESIVGCYFNVVGLPMPRLIVELRNFGIDVFARGRSQGGKM